MNVIIELGPADLLRLKAGGQLKRAGITVVLDDHVLAGPDSREPGLLVLHPATLEMIGAGLADRPTTRGGDRVDLRGAHHDR